MDVEQTLGSEAVERLSGRNQLVPCDADPDVLLLAIDEGGGGHAGSIGLTLGTSLLTLGCGAVTPEGCRDGREQNMC